MLLILLLSTFINSDSVGNCRVNILHEGEGNDYDEDGGVSGFHNTVDCCYDFKYCYLIEHSGVDNTRYELRVTKRCDGRYEQTVVVDYITLDSGEWDILCYSPPEDNCNCEYKINLYSNSSGIWLQVLENGDNVRVNIECKEECK